jgi:hypothetical protein
MGTRHLYSILTGPSFAVQLYYSLCNLSLQNNEIYVIVLLLFNAVLGTAKRSTHDSKRDNFVQNRPLTMS